TIHRLCQQMGGLPSCQHRDVIDLTCRDGTLHLSAYLGVKVIEPIVVQAPAGLVFKRLPTVGQRRLAAHGGQGPGGRGKDKKKKENKTRAQESATSTHHGSLRISDHRVSVILVDGLLVTDLIGQRDRAKLKVGFGETLTTAA